MIKISTIQFMIWLLALFHVYVEAVCVPSLPDPSLTLRYVGSVFNADNGFSCGSDSDDEVDARIDDACNAAYSGSRNIRGVELANGEFNNIINLPPSPIWPFLPSCECGAGCGNTCDAGGSRLCQLEFSGGGWDIADPLSGFVPNHGGFVLSGECVVASVPQDYYLVDNTVADLDFHDANDYCGVAYGTQLATINTQDDVNKAKAVIAADPGNFPTDPDTAAGVLIGLHDEDFNTHCLCYKHISGLPCQASHGAGCGREDIWINCNWNEEACVLFYPYNNGYNKQGIDNKQDCYEPADYFLCDGFHYGEGPGL